jgi:sugar-specific transcriptional regulator TrmB
MISDIIKSTLLELGCSELDAKIYQLLLDKKISVTHLAKTLNVHREKIYTALSNLQNIGLINKKPDYSREIEVISPMHILSLLKIKAARTNKSAQDFGEVLPDLLLNFGDSLQDKKIEHLNGESDFIRAFDQLIDKSEGEILCYISPLYLYQVVDVSFLKYWVKKRTSSNVKVRLLASKEQSYVYESDQELQPNSAKLREIKYFDSAVKFQGTFCICGTTLYFFNPILMEVFVIKDKIMSETLRSMFEMLWVSVEV